MDKISALTSNLRPPCTPRPLPRNFHTAAMVAGLYVMTALGAPWIVRYAPGTESSVIESLAERPPLIRCATAPEFGMPCGAWLREAGTRRPTGAA